MSRIVLAILALLSLPASAMTYVMVPDERLVEDAQLIVVGRVLGLTPAGSDSRPVTRYAVEIERTLGGAAHAATIMLRVPGGIASNGLALRVNGVPRFASGERAILFLMRNDDDSYTPLHFSLGTFRESVAGQKRVASRDLDGGVELVPAGREALSEGAKRMRDFARFADWIADRRAGAERPSDYWLEAPKHQNVSAQHTFFLVDGRHLRWPLFQLGYEVPWFLASVDDTNVDDFNVDGVRHAIDAWRDAGETLVEYSFAGRSDANRGLSEYDGENTILFGDPWEEASGRFSCTGGGVLAIGGPWFDTSLRTSYRGSEVVRIVGADVVFNDGVECIMTLFASTAAVRFEEVIAHELGHTLGIGHSCGDDSAGPCTGNALLNDAIMRAHAHLDGRGAQLNEDDLAAADTLYRVEGPILSWEASSRRIRLGSAIHFSPTATPEGATWEWDFGDGSDVSTSESTSHTYAQPGSYTVVLRATDASGTNAISSTIEVATPRGRAVRH